MECTTGAMPNRVRIMPPVLKPVGWLDHDRRRRLFSVVLEENNDGKVEI
jgi:hypothetical protein